jgi:hypothetical protein
MVHACILFSVVDTQTVFTRILLYVGITFYSVAWAVRQQHTYVRGHSKIVAATCAGLEDTQRPAAIQHLWILSSFPAPGAGAEQQAYDPFVLSRSSSHTYTYCTGPLLLYSHTCVDQA